MVSLPMRFGRCSFWQWLWSVLYFLISFLWLLHLGLNYFILKKKVFGQFMINNYKNYGVMHPALENDTYLTTIGSISSFCNGSSRIIWATFFDKYGFRCVFYTAAVTQVNIEKLNNNSGLSLIFLNMKNHK